MRQDEVQLEVETGDLELLLLGQEINDSMVASGNETC